ncbi:MAG: phosphoglucosamine mutase [Nitrososphaerota archaeon]|nr:phosphoglucosamine mutase [Nitrososphaerota archaeon]MDG6977579.1 phosphoglucosamine mutase [Nitrososphaerota archaeon]
MLAPRGRLFGTNGVRFIPGVTGDVGFAIKLAESVGTYFADGELLTGRDGRLTGQMLFASVTAGLMSSGRNVAEAGIVPTPALQFATKALGYRGSVMITASHNPPEYNGVKVMGPDGVEVSRLDEQRIEKIFQEGTSRKADWKEVGSPRPEPNVIRAYINGILSKVNSKLISERRFKVAVDPGNGAQALAAPYLLEALGCKVVTINSIVDGSFPGRGPEPTPENLRDLVVAVRASHADLGVAYDGDGDRSIFCDEGGNLYWGDQSGSLIADYLLERNPNSTVVTPISSSQVIEAVAKRRGGKVLRTRVGSVDVSRTIIERKALMGFEENGGGFFPAHIPTRDGGMTTAMMLEVMAARAGAVSKLMATAFPRFYLTKTKVPVDPSKVREVMRNIERRADGKVEKVDGLKVWVDDKTWALIRASGTEPMVRVFVEAETKEKADATAKRFVKAVKAG